MFGSWPLLYLMEAVLHRYVLKGNRRLQIAFIMVPVRKIGLPFAVNVVDLWR